MVECHLTGIDIEFDFVQFARVLHPRRMVWVGVTMQAVGPPTTCGCGRSSAKVLMADGHSQSDTYLAECYNNQTGERRFVRAASDTSSHGDKPSERKAQRLLEVLRDRQPDVLRYAHERKVPPISNQGERDLRLAKIQQKISGRLTSEKRTEDRYRIRGYLSTAAKHHPNMMDTLRDAILGRPWIPPEPFPV